MRVLVAIDGSRYSDAAVRCVAERPHLPDSQVKVLHVIEPAIRLFPIMRLLRNPRVSRKLNLSGAATSPFAIRREFGKAVDWLLTGEEKK